MTLERQGVLFLVGLILGTIIVPMYPSYLIWRWFRPHDANKLMLCFDLFIIEWALIFAFMHQFVAAIGALLFLGIVNCVYDMFMMRRYPRDISF